MTDVRTAEKSELAECAAIAERLPLYFSESALELLRRDLDVHEVFVAADDGHIVGFVSLDAKSPAVREISWLAVAPEAQSGGTGSLLIEEAEAQSRASGVSLLEVKTLAPRDDATNYDATRRFYERHGFAMVEIVDPFPGWDPGNPCAIYVKALCG